MVSNLATTDGLRRTVLYRLFHEGWKYSLASVLALIVDYGLLVGLTELLGIHYLISAAIGFSAGSVVSYALSVRFVFSERSIENRHLEFSYFCIIGGLGLALNEGIIAAAVTWAGMSYVLAKIPAAAISFVFNFAIRRWLLFSKVGSLSAGV